MMISTQIKLFPILVPPEGVIVCKVRGCSLLTFPPAFSFPLTSKTTTYDQSTLTR